MKIRTTNDHYGLNNCNGLPKSVMHFEEAQLVSHLAGSQLTELACKYLIHIRYLPTVLAFRTKLENGTTKKGKKRIINCHNILWYVKDYTLLTFLKPAVYLIMLLLPVLVLWTFFLTSRIKLFFIFSLLTPVQDINWQFSPKKCRKLEKTLLLMGNRRAS